MLEVHLGRVPLDLEPVVDVDRVRSAGALASPSASGPVEPRRERPPSTDPTLPRVTWRAVRPLPRLTLLDRRHRLDKAAPCPTASVRPPRSPVPAPAPPDRTPIALERAPVTASISAPIRSTPPDEAGSGPSAVGSDDEFERSSSCGSWAAASGGSRDRAGQSNRTTWPRSGARRPEDAEPPTGHPRRHHLVPPHRQTAQPDEAVPFRIHQHHSLEEYSVPIPNNDPRCADHRRLVQFRIQRNRSPGGCDRRRERSRGSRTLKIRHRRCKGQR